MNAPVLVTGGAGFIGSHVVELLLERGHPVRVLDKLVDQVHGGGGPRHLPPDAEFVLGDLQEASVVRRALRGAGAVVHLAAEVGVGQSMYEIVRYVGANTGGTAVLLELLANEPHEVGRIVVASSMSIYGEGAYRCARDGEVWPRLRTADQLARREWTLRCPACRGALEPVPTREDKPLFPTSIYAISKLDQELMCLSVGQAYGIPVTALRYFNTYGPRQALSNPYTGVAAIFSSRLLNGKRPLVFEDGRQRRDFVHVRDVARATVLALESERAAGEVVNVGAGSPWSIAEVARALAVRLGVDLAPEITGKFRAGDVRDCYADVTKARELLGFAAQVPFEVGMDELVAWVAEQEADDRVARAAAELERRGLAR